MALTAAQTSTIFEIFGIPENGAATVVDQIGSLFGPSLEVYNHQAVVDNLNVRLAALTASQEALVTSLVAEWDEITSTDPLKVSNSNSDSGTLIDYPKQRQAIKDDLSNIIGFYVRKGAGFGKDGKAGGGFRISM